jgi:hypothetical protein
MTGRRSAVELSRQQRAAPTFKGFTTQVEGTETSPISHKLRRLGSADFQVCCIAGFQTGESSEGESSSDLGSRRHSRFGNLRYKAGESVGGICQRGGLICLKNR